MKINRIHILISLFALFVLYWDFFITDSLDLETSYVFFISILLLSRLLSLIRLKGELQTTILGLADFALVVMSILNFCITFPLVFGYLFSTGKLPATLILALIVNVGIAVSCSIELIQIMRRNTN